jgi:hypothetical protein
LAVRRLQLAILPGAVRNHEIEQPTLFARFLLSEQDVRAFREFEKLHALVEVALVGALVVLDRPEEGTLL